MSFVINALAKYIGVKDALKSDETVINKKIQDAYTESVASTVEKPCACGRPTTIYDFGEIENGKFDWTFYCNSYNPHSIDCSECGSRTIFNEDSSGKSIFDKRNVHGARLKVTHANIDAWSRERERNVNTESDDQSIRPF